MKFHVKKGDLVAFKGPFLRKVHEEDKESVDAFKENLNFGLVLGPPFIYEKYIKRLKRLGVDPAPADYYVSVLVKNKVYDFPAVWLEKVDDDTPCKKR